MRTETDFGRRALSLLLLAGAVLSAEPMPIRGIHLMAPKPEDVALLARFIRETLPKEGVNTLVLEVNYRFQYAKRPEVADPNALSQEQARSLAAAAREAGVKLIPQINLLGHQSWAKNTSGLLRSHPEFDETPGKYPGNEGIYCRSYCPLHPEIHALLFDLIDELTEAFGADTFHAGMDEVFILADENCPRCRGRLASDLFAGEVIAVRDHLARSGKKLWIWGDRLLDGAASGAGKWEASFNGTWPAIDRIPRDVVINDWHYEKAVPGAAWFAMYGFDVVSCPWRKPEVALAQINAMEGMRKSANSAVAGRMKGLLQTTWGDSGDFIRAYMGQPSKNQSLNEAVKCFRAAFARLREL
jgi:hypothetical protein